MPILSKDRTLPTAITNFSFNYALRNCGVNVIDAFDKSSDNYLYVYDNSILGYTDWTNIKPEFITKCFNVINLDANTLVLLPLDGRIIKAKDIIQGGICDCILLSENNMCLIEFKTNATSTNPLRIIDNATDAIRQLWHTFYDVLIPKCAAVSKDLNQLKQIEFYIVFNKELNVTSANSTLMDLQNQFLEDKRYPLYFNNTKTFKMV